MTDWKSVEMARCKGEKDFNLILECSPGKYFYKFYVNNEWCIDDSQPISTYTMPRKSNSTKGNTLHFYNFTGLDPLAIPMQFPVNPTEFHGML